MIAGNSHKERTSLQTPPKIALLTSAICRQIELCGFDLCGSYDTTLGRRSALGALETSLVFVLNVSMQLGLDVITRYNVSYFLAVRHFRLMCTLICKLNQTIHMRTRCYIC